MSDQDTLPSKEKKFFFDNIHFDETEEEISEEEDTPPPPTFSEEELSDARRTSYERGKEDGIAEAHRSFEKQTEVLLEVVARDIQTLFTSEDERAKLYETEAVRLADTIFKRLFPVLNERHGIDEITSVIEKVIQSQPETHGIQLYVAPVFRDQIEEHIRNNPHIQNAGGSVNVMADDALEAGDCRLKWKDGGGLRDISTLSAQIAKEIEVLLADSPVNKDNKSHKVSVSIPSDDTETQPQEQKNQDRDDVSLPEADGDK